MSKPLTLEALERIFNLSQLEMDRGDAWTIAKKALSPPPHRTQGS